MPGSELTTARTIPQQADTTGALAALLNERIRTRQARVAVLGLGYAGLPMAVELARVGFSVTGIDIDLERVALVAAGRSPVSDVTDAELAALTAAGQLRITGDFAALDQVDCVLVCVPTPLTSDRTPDLRFVQAATEAIAQWLHPGMLVMLQSTSPPGTTRHTMAAVLEASSGLRAGEDFFVAHAPERIDPGNSAFDLRNTPKVLGGLTPNCTALAAALFAPVVAQIVRVSSPEAAEMAKLVENTFRFINISFINEITLLCDRLGIDVWETIDAAATKPFAFMPHYPGPGVGGDCIPVVPFFLQSSAREHEMVTGMIQAAGQVNDAMPGFLVAKLDRLLAERGMHLPTARVLLLGMAYKPNVADVRESPSLRVLGLLRQRGADVAYYDPYVPQVTVGAVTVPSLPLHEALFGQFDCAVLLTPHRDVDYGQIVQNVRLFFDTRNHLKGTYSEVVRL